MDALMERMPSPLRERLGRLQWARRMRDAVIARTRAVGGKRLDLCAAQMAQVLQLSGAPSLTGKVCAELGSGWVLSHALIMHLLGASRVIATDIEPVARPAVLRRAIHESNEASVRDLLAPFAGHTAVRERLTALREIRTFDVATLAQLGIEYRAPIDLAAAPLDEPVDFAFSFSVLEHVPTADVRPLLLNLATAIRPGGAMLHAIHLEDHRDFTAPFAFLTEPAREYDREEQIRRGNRLRASEWLRIFGTIPGFNTSLVYAWQRLDRPLPVALDPEISFTDELDLRTSHMGVYASR